MCPIIMILCISGSSNMAVKIKLISKYFLEEMEYIALWMAGYAFEGYSNKKINTVIKV